MTMRTAGRIAWTFALSLALAGCQSSGKKPYSDNPLLMSREPLAQAPPSKPGPKPGPTSWDRSSPPHGKPELAKSNPASSTPAVTRVVGPQTPDLDEIPSFAQTLKPKTAPIESVVHSEPEIPASVPPQTPELKIAAIVPVSATATAPQKRFDHSADYAWLVGEIDVHYRGYKELRFCPISEDDAIGGKVQLLDDAAIQSLQPGDWVKIAGELVRDNNDGNRYPTYRVRNVQVLERKDK